SVMQVYLDGSKVYQTSGGRLSTSLTAGAGSHRLTVQAYSGSAIAKSTIYFTVGGGSGTTPAPKPASAPTSTPSGATYQHIERMGGWQNCDKCAGKNGNGPAAPHGMAQGISSPSMTGSSVEFWLGGSTPFSNALWWKQLGARPDTSHFVYDLWFYLKNP